MRSNSSQGPIAVRLAMSAALPAFSAVTYLPLTLAFSDTLPSPLRMSWNFSHEPTAPRLAISDAAPAFSAHTYWLLTCARSAMNPPPASMRSNCCAAPIAVALAMSGEAPAVTYLPLACARRLMTLFGGGVEPTEQSPATAPAVVRMPPSRMCRKLASL
jgi:hypothetical protein